MSDPPVAPGAVGLEALLNELHEVLKSARQFIRNGVEFGYITMPDTPYDSAHVVPGAIDKALKAIEAALPLPSGGLQTCNAEMCVCGHFHCKHDGALFRGVYTCDECECLGFTPASPRQDRA